MTSIDLKRTSWIAAILAASVAFTLPASTAYAQEGEEGEEVEEYDPPDRDNPNDLKVVKGKNQWGLTTGFVATPEDTGTVTNAISGSYDFCSRIRPDDYFVDCLGEQLEEIAAALPDTGDYKEAKEILTEASVKLRRLAAANAAPSKPRIRAKGTVGGKQITTKPLTPVRADRKKAVNEAAAKILEEAETKLLRSAQASDRRLIAYAQMAKAVGSNKTLLRSA